jgi:nucleotide-binding universal stress UspA family protein
VDLSRVLAAVDFSSPARSAFDYALALAKRHGAELVVVQAVPPEQPFNREGRERFALKTSLGRSAEEAQVEFTYRVQHHTIPLRWPTLIEMVFWMCSFAAGFKPIKAAASSDPEPLKLEREKRKLQLRKDLLKQCKRIARTQDRKLNQVIESALEEYIQRHGAPE